MPKRLGAHPLSLLRFGVCLVVSVGVLWLAVDVQYLVNFTKTNMTFHPREEALDNTTTTTTISCECCQGKSLCVAQRNYSFVYSSNTTHGSGPKFTIQQWFVIGENTKDWFEYCGRCCRTNCSSFGTTRVSKQQQNVGVPITLDTCMVSPLPAKDMTHLPLEITMHPFCGLYYEILQIEP